MASTQSKDRAKVFMAGKSQAVRLPKKFRFAAGCDEVSIRKIGRSLILSPRYADWDEFWANTSPLDDDVIEAIFADDEEAIDDPKRAAFDL